MHVGVCICEVCVCGATECAFVEGLFGSEVGWGDVSDICA